MQSNFTIRDFLESRKSNGMSWDEFRKLKEKYDGPQYSDHQHQLYRKKLDKERAAKLKAREKDKKRAERKSREKQKRKENRDRSARRHDDSSAGESDEASHRRRHRHDRECERGGRPASLDHEASRSRSRTRSPYDRSAEDRRDYYGHRRRGESRDREASRSPARRHHRESRDREASRSPVRRPRSRTRSPYDRSAEDRRDYYGRRRRGESRDRHQSPVDVAKRDDRRSRCNRSRSRSSRRYHRSSRRRSRSPPALEPRS